MRISQESREMIINDEAEIPIGLSFFLIEFFLVGNFEFFFTFSIKM